jgi:hypothetical protein
MTKESANAKDSCKRSGFPGMKLTVSSERFSSQESKRVAARIKKKNL